MYVFFALNYVCEYILHGDREDSDSLWEKMAWQPVVIAGGNAEFFQTCNYMNVHTLHTVYCFFSSTCAS